MPRRPGRRFQIWAPSTPRRAAHDAPHARVPPVDPSQPGRRRCAISCAALRNFATSTLHFALKKLFTSSSSSWTSSSASLSTTASHAIGSLVVYCPIPPSVFARPRAAWRRFFAGSRSIFRQRAFCKRRSSAASCFKKAGFGAASALRSHERQRLLEAPLVLVHQVAKAQATALPVPRSDYVDQNSLSRDKRLVNKSAYLLRDDASPRVVRVK